MSQVDPFTNKHPDATWESVTEHLNFIFHSNNPGLEADLTPRTVRDKVDRMLKQFRANDNRKFASRHNIVVNTKTTVFISICHAAQMHHFVRKFRFFSISVQVWYGGRAHRETDASTRDQ